MKHPISRALAQAVALLAGAAALFAQSAANIEVLQLRPNFYMIGGAGSNIGVQIGIDGVIVVDSGTDGNAESVVTAIRNISPRPIRYVINTSADADHVGGNIIVAKAGQTLLTRSGTVMGADSSGSILATENVLTRMSSGKNPAFPLAAWPTETFSKPRKYFYLNGEGIEVFSQPAAHTDGDSIVFFRRSDVIVSGDIFDITRFPIIDTSRGGTVQGVIAALQKLVDTAIPSVPIVSRDDGTLIIPGHGRVCNQFDVVEYRDMVTIIRDRIRDLIKEGRSLEQVKAASPARGYERRFGSTLGSTQNFVEAVYHSLGGK